MCTIRNKIIAPLQFNLLKLVEISKNLQCIYVCRDECVNFPIQKGLDASRSKIKYFRHNDCDHLEQLLTQQAAEDKKV